MKTASNNNHSSKRSNDGSSGKPRRVSTQDSDLNCLIFIGNGECLRSAENDDIIYHHWRMQCPIDCNSGVLNDVGAIP